MVFGMQPMVFVQFVTNIGLLPIVIWYMMKSSKEREDRLMNYINYQSKTFSKITGLLDRIEMRVCNIENCIMREESRWMLYKLIYNSRTNSNR
jgi:uncharacterized Tic20 family protein